MNEEFNHFRNCTIYSANCLSHNITTLFIISFDITLTLPYQRILLNHLVIRKSYGYICIYKIKGHVLYMDYNSYKHANSFINSITQD